MRPESEQWRDTAGRTRTGVGMVTMRGALEKALRAATVPLSSHGGVVGTGFAVAPDLVLTCAHVVCADGVPPTAVRAAATQYQPATTLTVVADSVRLAGADGGLDLVLLRAQGAAPFEAYP